MDPSLWWQCCEADPNATFFSTPDWCGTLVDSFPAFRARPFLFTFPDGIRYVVPAVEVRRAWGRFSALHSMPFGTYGGIVGHPSPDPEVAHSILNHLCAEGWSRYQTTVFPNPLGDALPDSLADQAEHVYTPNLHEGWEGYLTTLDSRTRYHVRKSERRGVIVQCEDDRDTYEEFSRLYERSAQAWNPLVRFDASFFRALWYRMSEHVQLWTAHWRGRMVAGVLVFRYGNQVTPFLSAIHPDARSLAPTNLIYARLVRSCCDHGWTRFSFLGSGGKDSVERFKRSMGGERREFRYVDLRGPSFNVVRNPLLTSVRKLGRRVRSASSR